MNRFSKFYKKLKGVESLIFPPTHLRHRQSKLFVQLLLLKFLAKDQRTIKCNQHIKKLLDILQAGIKSLYVTSPRKNIPRIIVNSYIYHMRMYTENIKNTNFLMDKRQNNKKTLTCIGKKKQMLTPIASYAYPNSNI